jgi:hypothetical protein
VRTGDDRTAPGSYFLIGYHLSSVELSNLTAERGTPSSGMLLPVALVRTDVSDEGITAIIRVTRIGEVGTT